MNLRFTVSEADIKSAESLQDQLILSILRKQGAPILGEFNLRVDPEYEVLHAEKGNGDNIFIFKRKTDG